MKFITCDHDPVNRASCKSLQVSTDEPFFIVNGHKIHCFIETLHFLKILQNNFRKYGEKLEIPWCLGGM